MYWGVLWNSDTLEQLLKKAGMRRDKSTEQTGDNMVCITTNYAFYSDIVWHASELPKH